MISDFEPSTNMPDGRGEAIVLIERISADLIEVARHHRLSLLTHLLEMTNLAAEETKDPLSMDEEDLLRQR